MSRELTLSLMARAQSAHIGGAGVVGLEQIGDLVGLDRVVEGGHVVAELLGPYR